MSSRTDPPDRYYTVNRRLWNRGSSSWRARKFAKYTSEGFVEVESGDRVLDIGAFLGEFAIPAAKEARTVLAIEPDSRTFHCLKLNVAGIQNITPIQRLVGKESSQVQFHLGHDPTENSLIDVDKGDYTTVEMLAGRLDEIVHEMGYDRIDFLKIDAEGAEPEVLEGLGDLEISKIVVDVGNERRGESTLQAVKQKLIAREFEVRVTRPSEDQTIIFGKQ